MERLRYLPVMLIIVLGLCVLPVQGAKAGEYPSKPVTIVIPWGPGSLSFSLAQLIGDEMGKILGQRFMVIAKPGGSGAKASNFIKNSRPDGYTLYQPWIAPFVMVPIRNPNVQYDPLKDFDLLAYATQNPVVALALKDAPYKNLKEFVDYVKKNPGRIFKFGSGGAMSLHSIYGNTVFQNAGVKVQAVYYQASSKSLPDLLGKNLDVCFSTFMALKPYEEIGAIGVFGSERLPQFKAVPTVKEQGLAAPVTMAWSGIAAPKGLPPEVWDKLVVTLREVLTNEEVKGRIFGRLNQFVDYRGPEGFKRIIERDLRDMRGPVQKVMEMKK
jgi:tripartite-type tricarboxylate transporter receptor subunit TctC